MDKLQNVLDRINSKIGGVGAVLSVLFWVIVLYFALRSMLFSH